MEKDVVRVRIDPALKQKAIEICDQLGLDLTDVVRLFIARLVREGAVPFELTAQRSGEKRNRPFSEYRNDLFDLQPVNYEVALTVLWRFVAKLTAQIYDEKTKKDPDRTMLSNWEEELKKANALSRTLSPNDKKAVQDVLDTYGPRVRSS